MLTQGPLTNKGYFLVERNWMDFSVFKKAPYTEREAWLYLLENAAFQPIVREVDGMTITLGIGQLVASCRYLAEAWGWKTKSGIAKDRVMRFMHKIERHGWIMINTDYSVKCDRSETAYKVPYDKRSSLITIINYKDLQRKPRHRIDATQDISSQKNETVSLQRQDKPNQGKLTESNEARKEQVGLGSKDQYLFEKFPQVTAPHEFIDHMPGDWQQYVFVEKDLDEYWLEEEAERFWARYAGEDIDDREKRLNVLEKRSYWNKVWIKWCNQEFRNYYPS